MQTFDTFDEAYKALLLPLTYRAKTMLIRNDYAIDAVQDTFVKVVEYLKKRPKAKISAYIIQRELNRSCRRLNKKYSPDWQAGSYVDEWESKDVNVEE